MWANPDLPFDPKTALPIRHPLLVAVCRCWRRLRFSHVLTARQASTSERAAVGGASSTEMGQLFQPLAVLSHHLHCYNNGLRTQTPPAHDDGRVTPHYTISLTATAEEHPNTVMSAPLRHPAVSWYGAHRHPLRMWAAPPPQSSYGALPPRGRQLQWWTGCRAVIWMLSCWVILILTCKKVTQHGIPQYPYLA